MASPTPASPTPAPSPWDRLTDGPLGPVLDAFHVDFVPADPQPSWARWVVASIVALAGSLAADAVVVAAGKAVFPTTEHFVHFHVSDYAKLTVIGVVVACIGWPVVTRITSRPRWLFYRMAVAVTLVLFLPDLYIWWRGQPGRGVLVLMCMHVAIALVTYNALVRIAPAGEAVPDGPDVRG
jgi:hypothetical protein